MYKISTVVLIKKMDYCVWNIVFQMDNGPVQFTTDFLYLIKEKKWVFNSLITHELTSMMEGRICIYCGENKIACFVASKDFIQIKQKIIEMDILRNEVSNETGLLIDDVSTDYIVLNDKNEWQKSAEENRFYGNILRIQRKNNQ